MHCLRNWFIDQKSSKICPILRNPLAPGEEEAEKKLLSMMHCRVTRQIHGENGNGECGNVQMGEGQWGEGAREGALMQLMPNGTKAGRKPLSAEEITQLLRGGISDMMMSLFVQNQ